MKPELRDELLTLADTMRRFAGSDPQPKRPAPPQVRSVRVNGALYVRADDVADLLDERGLVPGLVTTLRKAAQ